MNTEPIKLDDLFGKDCLANVKEVGKKAKIAQKAISDFHEALKTLRKFNPALNDLINEPVETDLLSWRYLMKLHPELSEQGAISLLEFSTSRTISLKSCYGDGSIIFPMWDKETNR